MAVDSLDSGVTQAADSQLRIRVPLHIHLGKINKFTLMISYPGWPTPPPLLALINFIEINNIFFLFTLL